MTPIEILKETREKLNKVYLRLAYGSSNIEVAKSQVDSILTEYGKSLTIKLLEGIIEEIKNKKETIHYEHAGDALKDQIAYLESQLSEIKKI